MSGVSVELAEKTLVDKLVEEGGRDPRTVLDREAAIKEAERLLEALRGFDANIAEFGDKLPPVVIVRSSKYIMYVLVFNPGYLLSGSDAYHMIEELLPYIEKLKEAHKNVVLLFYARKGMLTTAAYLYLGSVIENHGVGILFVNGGVDEILEIAWSLENVGKFEAQEEDAVDLTELS
jgi:hypothetical protein